MNFSKLRQQGTTTRNKSVPKIAYFVSSTFCRPNRKAIIITGKMRKTNQYQWQYPFRRFSRWMVLNVCMSMHRGILELYLYQCIVLLVLICKPKVYM